MIVVDRLPRDIEALSHVSTDEHLLERISTAENRLARLTERLERSLDFCCDRPKTLTSIVP